jgi:hypothetical protein
MEVEDEDSILERLFFKRYGRALPEKEKEKEKEKDVDINFVIDLTDENEEMEVAAPVVVVKTEPIEAAEVAEINTNTDTDVSTVKTVASVTNVTNRRHSFRLERLELAKARKAITEFGKSLRKKDIIPEKEAPLAAGKSENVIADTDSNMSEDMSVNPESVITVKNIQTAEQIIAESNAMIEASQKEFVAEFGDVPLDEFDEDDLHIEPLC